jgi:tape measure domain-containing protein
MAASALSGYSDDSLDLDIQLTADTSSLERELDNLTSREIGVNGTRTTPTSSDQDIEIDLSGTFSKELGKQIEKVQKDLQGGNLLGGFSTALAGPVKAALKALSLPTSTISGAIGTITRGAFQEVGHTITHEFAKSATAGIFEPFAQIFGSGGEIGNALGKTLGSGIKKFADDFYKTSTGALDYVESLASGSADYTQISGAIQAFFQVQGAGLSEEMRLYNDVITLLFSEKNVKSYIKPAAPTLAEQAKAAKSSISKTQNAIAETFSPDEVEEIRAARSAEQKSAKKRRKQLAQPERLEVIAEQYRSIQKEADYSLNGESRFAEVEKALAKKIDETQELADGYREALKELAANPTRENRSEVTELRRSEVLPPLEKAALDKSTSLAEQQAVVSRLRKEMEDGPKIFSDRSQSSSARLAAASASDKARRSLPAAEVELNARMVNSAKANTALKAQQSKELSQAEAEAFLAQKVAIADKQKLLAEKKLAEQQELVAQIRASRELQNQKLKVLSEERKYLQGGSEKPYLTAKIAATQSVRADKETQKNKLVDAGDESGLKVIDKEIESLEKEIAKLTNALADADQIPKGIETQMQRIEKALGVVFAEKPELIDSTARLEQSGANASVSQTGRSISLSRELLSKASADTLDDSDIEVVREELIHFLQVSGQLGDNFAISSQELAKVSDELQQYIGIASDDAIKLEAQAKVLRDRVGDSAEADDLGDKIAKSDYNPAFNPGLRERAKALGPEAYQKVDDLLKKSEASKHQAQLISLSRKSGVDTNNTQIGEANQLLRSAVKDQKLAYAFIKDLTIAQQSKSEEEGIGSSSVAIAQLSADALEGSTRLEQFADAVSTATTNLTALVGAIAASPQLRAVARGTLATAKQAGKAAYGAAEFGEKAAFSMIPGAALARKPIKAVMQATVLPGAALAGISAINPAIGGALTVGSQAISHGLAPVTDMVIGHLGHVVGQVVDHALPGFVKTGALQGIGNTIQSGVVESFELTARAGAAVLRNNAAKGIELGGIGFAAQRIASGVVSTGRDAITSAVGKVNPKAKAAILRRQGIVEVSASPWEDGDDLNSLKSRAADAVQKAKTTITSEIEKALDSGAIGDALVAGASTVASVSTAGYGPVAQAIAEITATIVARGATNAAAIALERSRIAKNLPRLSPMLGRDLGDKLTGDISGFLLGKVAMGATGSGLASAGAGMALVPQIQAIRKNMLGQLSGDDLFSLSPENVAAIKASEQALREIEESIQRIISLEEEYEASLKRVEQQTVSVEHSNRERLKESTKAQLRETEISKAILERDYGQQKAAELKNAFVIGGRRDPKLLRDAETYSKMAQRAVPNAESKTEDEYYRDYQREESRKKRIGKAARKDEIADEIAKLKNGFVIGGRVDKNLISSIAILNEELDLLNGKKNQASEPVSFRISLVKSEDLGQFKLRQPEKDRQLLPQRSLSIADRLQSVLSNTPVIGPALQLIPESWINVLKGQVNKIVRGVIAPLKASIAQDGILGTIKKIAPKIIPLAIALTATVVAFKVTESAKAALQKNATIDATLSGVSGSTRNAIKSSGSDLSKQGVDRTTQATAQASFAAANQAFGLSESSSIKQLDEFLLSAKKRGMTDDAASGVLTALSQVREKGLYTEELQQIQERLPGARGLAAKAAGVDPRNLGKAVESGSIDSEAFVKNFLSEFAGQTRISDSTKNPEIVDSKLGAAADKVALAIGGNLAGAIVYLKNVTADAINTMGPVIPLLGAIAGSGLMVGTVMAGSATLGLIGFITGLTRAQVAMQGLALASSGLMTIVRAVPQLLLLAAGFQAVSGAIQMIDGTAAIKQLRELREATDRLTEAERKRNGNKPAKTEGVNYLGRSGEKLLKLDLVGAATTALGSATLNALGGRVGKAYNYDRDGKKMSGFQDSLFLSSDQLGARQEIDEAKKGMDSQKRNIESANVIIDKARKGQATEADKEAATEIAKKLKAFQGAIEMMDPDLLAEEPELLRFAKSLTDIADQLEGNDVTQRIQKAIQGLTASLENGQRSLTLATSQLGLDVAKADQRKESSPLEKAIAQSALSDKKTSRARDLTSLANIKEDILINGAGKLKTGDALKKAQDEILSLKAEALQSLTEVAQVEATIAQEMRKQALFRQDLSRSGRDAFIERDSKTSQGAITRMTALDPGNLPEHSDVMTQSSELAAQNSRLRALRANLSEIQSNYAQGLIDADQLEQQSGQARIAIADKESEIREQAANLLISKEKVRRAEVTRILSIEKEISAMVADRNDSLLSKRSDQIGRQADSGTQQNTLSSASAQGKLSGIESIRSIYDQVKDATVKSIGAIYNRLKSLGGDTSVLGLGRFGYRDDRSGRDIEVQSANASYELSRKQFTLEVDLFNLKKAALDQELKKQEILLGIEEKKARLLNSRAISEAQAEGEIAKESGDKKGEVLAKIKLGFALQDRSLIDTEFKEKRILLKGDGIVKGFQSKAEGAQLADKLKGDVVRNADGLVISKKGRDPNSTNFRDFDSSRVNNLDKLIDRLIPKSVDFNPQLPRENGNSKPLSAYGEVKIEMINNFHGSDPNQGMDVSRKIADAIKANMKGLVGN